MSLLRRLFPLLMLLCVPVLPALADAPVLSLPLKCTIEQDCWVVNYVDTDPRPDAVRDFECARRSYDAHDGTDFTVRDWAAMAAGVDVLAAAAGTVVNVRDGVPDLVLDNAARQALLAKGKGCGNGVLLDHGGGYRTLYCHMKRGSVRAKPGEAVAASAILGQVGYSGNTQFPHLHFGMLKDGRAVDPFTGRVQPQGCAPLAAGEKPLWDPALGLVYEPVSIYTTGFSPGAPDFEMIRKTTLSWPVIGRDAPGLAFWVGIFGAAQGDRITLEILNPVGKVLARRAITQDKSRIRQFYYAGVAGKGLFDQGVYQGQVRVERALKDGTVLRREKTMTLKVE